MDLTEQRQGWVAWQLHHAVKHLTKGDSTNCDRRVGHRLNLHLLVQIHHANKPRVCHAGLVIDVSLGYRDQVVEVEFGLVALVVQDRGLRFLSPILGEESLVRGKLS